VGNVILYKSNVQPFNRFRCQTQEKYDIDALIQADSVLFFDMDGTLIDTDYANFLSYKKAIHAYNRQNQM